MKEIQQLTEASDKAETPPRFRMSNKVTTDKNELLCADHEPVRVEISLDAWVRVYKALEAGKDNAKELLNQVDDGVSVMTKREKAIAEMYQREIAEAADLMLYAEKHGAIPF